MFSTTLRGNVREKPALGSNLAQTDLVRSWPVFVVESAFGKHPASTFQSVLQDTLLKGPGGSAVKERWVLQAGLRRPEPSLCSVSSQCLRHRFGSKEIFIIRRAAQGEGWGPFPKPPCPAEPRDSLSMFGERGEYMRGGRRFLKTFRKRGALK